MKKAHVITSVVVIVAVGLGTGHVIQEATATKPVAPVVAPTPPKPAPVAPVVAKPVAPTPQNTTPTKSSYSLPAVPATTTVK